MMTPARTLLTLVAFATTPGCLCTPSDQCQLVRALCKIDVCIKTDVTGWTACQSLPSSCDPIEGACTTRAECMEQFMQRCTERMSPGAPDHARYAACASLDCSASAPPPPTTPDARLAPDAGPVCPGVMCEGRCCTAYPCFTGKRCACLPSVSACVPPDAGDGAPGITPTCCSDAPLCAAQNKVCCFVPGTTEGAPAQTRCMTKCISESRHCTFAPYKQSDGERSCLPPPFDTADIACPF